MTGVISLSGGLVELLVHFPSNKTYSVKGDYLRNTYIPDIAGSAWWDARNRASNRKKSVGMFAWFQCWLAFSILRRATSKCTPDVMLWNSRLLQRHWRHEPWRTTDGAISSIFASFTTRWQAVKAVNFNLFYWRRSQNEAENLRYSSETVTLVYITGIWHEELLHWGFLQFSQLAPMHCAHL